MLIGNNRGIASLELVPLLVLFAMLFNFTLGFFGIIHSGILNSIASRNYTFETFRQRANLTYLRDIKTERSVDEEMRSKYTKFYYRFHGIISETNAGRQDWIATQRPMKFTDIAGGSPKVSNRNDHMFLVRTIQSNRKVSDVFTEKFAGSGKSGVDPVWITTLYGICLNANCLPK